MISDAFGAGVEWETVTPFTDEETIVSSEGSGERSSAATASYGHNGVRTPTFRAPVGHVVGGHPATAQPAIPHQQSDPRTGARRDSNPRPPA